MITFLNFVSKFRKINLSASGSTSHRLVVIVTTTDWMDNKHRSLCWSKCMGHGGDQPVVPPSVQPPWKPLTQLYTTDTRPWFVSLAIYVGNSQGTFSSVVRSPWRTRDAFLFYRNRAFLCIASQRVLVVVGRVPDEKKVGCCCVRCPP